MPYSVPPIRRETIAGRTRAVLLLACLAATGCGRHVAASRLGPQEPGRADETIIDPATLARIGRIEKRVIPPVLIRGRDLVKASLPERMTELQVPAVSIAVVDNYRVIWAKAYGELETGSGRPATTSTRFQAGSISKAVTALAALQLVEQGKLTLDDDVNRWLRTWRVPENQFTRIEKVTLRRLLSHTAGLTVSGFDGYERGKPVPSLRDVLDGKPPVNSAVVTVDTIPGSVFRYSGGGYAVLTQLIEDVTGRTFADYMDTEVLKRMGMTSSTFEPLATDTVNVASGHRGDGGVVPGKWHIYPERAAAALWTTPTDLTRYIIAVQRAYDAPSTSESRVLQPGLTREMLTARRGTTGLGPRLKTLPKETAPLEFTHNGGTDGYTSTFFGYLGSGRAIVIMTNGWNGLELAMDLARTVATEYGWAGHEPTERVPVQVIGSQLAALEGTYVPVDTGGGPPFIVRVEEGQLMFGRQGSPLAELFAQSDTTFFLNRRVYPTVTFTRSASGRTNQLALRGGSLTVVARRRGAE